MWITLKFNAHVARFWKTDTLLTKTLICHESYYPKTPSIILNIRRWTGFHKWLSFFMLWIAITCSMTTSLVFAVGILQYSTARFKLYAREYILASINTFSSSSQSMLTSMGSMLASKGSMLSSKGIMLSCMILLAIEIDACVQLLARIRHRVVSRCTRARLHALVHCFTRDSNLMLADITRQAFIKCLLAILIHEQ